MRSPSPPAGKLPLRDLVLLALLGSLMFASQVVMASLPNIHIVAVLIIVTALYFRWRALYAVFVFALLEGMIYGFGIWWVSYLYTWPVLAAVTVLLGRSESPLFWAVIAGIFGLCFGALCALPYLFAGGWAAAVSYWIAGIPFDLIHCASNFVITLVLFRPLYRVMGQLKGEVL
ncbi:MAG: hypothetical protein MSH16_02210 [Oscillospiraceae bacterium]|nr:hypothetical protein [Oscillospiraceae bacterium]MDD6503197.1 hypothetical protein [Oscillospiraceae bacterium]MDY4105572.1 hypothetical protein [Oscillospiraceae bacterium]